MLDVTKYRFALLLKDLGNGKAREFAFDFRIQIDEMPSQLRGQQATDCALA